MTSCFALPTFTKDKKAYVNARLFDPKSGLDAQGSLLTEGETILDLGPHLFPEGVPDSVEVIDCKGHLLTPGLIDIQVHFREPGQEYKETLHTGSRAAAFGGVTRVVCMPNTQPVIDDPSIVEFFHKKAAETSYVHLHAYGAITKGQKGENITEMALLKEEGVVGFTDDGKPVMNSLVMRRAMEYASMLGLPICQHAEDLHLSAGSCMNEGHVSARLGLQGVPNAAEAIIVERDLLLLEITGGHYHVLHISTHQAIDAVRRAKKKGLNVTCEAAPHHFALTDEAVEKHRSMAKMNPPLRAELDRLAVIEGLKDGTIDAIATDHAPHDFDSKNVSMEAATYGILGLETMLPLSLELYHHNHLSLRQVIASLTHKPADIIKVKAGILEKNAVADLTLIDLNHSWTIPSRGFTSKSQNSPFYDYPFKGRALRTIVKGQPVFTYNSDARDMLHL